MSTRTSTGQATWERDWREQVSEQLSASQQTHQQTMVVLERVIGRIDALEHRVVGLEKTPDSARTWVTSGGGCLAQALGVGVAVMAMLMSIAMPLIIYIISR